VYCIWLRARMGNNSNNLDTFVLGAKCRNQLFSVLLVLLPLVSMCCRNLIHLKRKMFRAYKSYILDSSAFHLMCHVYETCVSNCHNMRTGYISPKYTNIPPRITKFHRNLCFRVRRWHMPMYEGLPLFAFTKRISWNKLLSVRFGNIWFPVDQAIIHRYS
jgi:hypothetical protein